jgi:two-component system, OmpR family, phosphate regulon sensor histidine kinase PhoR
MLPLSAITLIFDSLTLALASAFLFIMLWHDAEKPLIRFFSIFLLMVIIWDMGSLLLQVGLLVVDDAGLINWAVSLIELGFAGSSVALYSLTTVTIGVHNHRFRAMTFASLLLIIFYRLFLITSTTPRIIVDIDNLSAYQLQPLFVPFYLLFGCATLFWLWQSRRKIRSSGLKAGIIIFLLGQSLIFVNPTLVVASFTTSTSFFGVLMVSVAIIQQEIMMPLSERLSQIEAMHKVSLAVSSQIALDTVLDEIAVQAAGWLSADGAGIFLADKLTGRQMRRLELTTVHNLPKQLLNLQVIPGVGLAGSVAKERKTIYLENYRRDWTGSDDFSLARDTFGSVIASPLIYGDAIIGVLMVIAGWQGRLFDSHDVYLLELLSAQAAVAISHSQFFKEQQQLTRQVEAARSQLEAVLTSTENPVIAVDRELKLIFSNPAAQSLFSVAKGAAVMDALPQHLFPKSPGQVMRDILRKGGYVYEVAIQDKVYLCHLAALGYGRVVGWVALLNDVTQLKELDRLKSEMVRMASHDLKNPLMGAMAYLDLLKDDLDELDYTASEKIIATIERQLERMNRIIRGILDIERIRTESDFAGEVCSPKKIVASAIVELEPFIAEKGILINTHIDERIASFWGNREQFKRVLVNLIENAVKFTLNDGQVWVSVYEDDDEVVFEVKDTGVGIPKAIQSRVFDRFFRGQQESVAHVTGSGLGLNLVKSIVEKHKGRIWLESEENRGTTFFVAIPISTNSSLSHSQL